MAESWATSEGTRRTMLANRRRDTSIELAVRRRLHSWGLRYRVDYPPLSGVRRRADIVFTRAKLAVFIDGCFWHQCPIHGVLPKQNASYWSPKLSANVARDANTNDMLTSAGWTVLRFWEHEDPDYVAAEIMAAVRPSNDGGWCAKFTSKSDA